MSKRSSSTSRTSLFFLGCCSYLLSANSAALCRRKHAQRPKNGSLKHVHFSALACPSKTAFGDLLLRVQYGLPSPVACLVLLLPVLLPCRKHNFPQGAGCSSVHDATHHLFSIASSELPFILPVGCHVRSLAGVGGCRPLLFVVSLRFPMLKPGRVFNGINLLLIETAGIPPKPPRKAPKSFQPRPPPPPSTLIPSTPILVKDKPQLCFAQHHAS